MNFELKPLKKTHIKQFKKDIQEAFQQGAEEEFGELEEEILPESHIDKSLFHKQSHAYEAIVDGKIVGGAIIIINEKTQHNNLDFLYVISEAQNKGIGKAIWNKIERLHPETKIWETHTPYFDKRNIHFYVNICGFQIVEYYNKIHRSPNEAEDLPDIEYFEDFLRFEKYMDNK